MDAIFRIIEGDAQDTEESLNKLSYDGYQFEIVAQSSFSKKTSYGTNTAIITTVKIKKREEI